MSGSSRCARPLPAALSLVLSLTSCGGSNDAPPEATKQPAVDSLERLDLFEDAVLQTPKKGVVPYDVIAPLYADNAEKLRFMVLPKGKKATYDPTEMWDYPDGTRFVKTFFYYADTRDPSLGRRLLETRIVEHEGDVWTGRTYVWNDAQTEAVRLKVGRTVDVSYVDANGDERSLEYRIPNDNECKTCHSKDHVFEPLGPRTRELDHVMGGGPDYGSADDPGKSPEGGTQVDRLASVGLLGGEISPRAERLALSDPYGTDPLVRRARSYLDANCSHCHRPGGEAGATALDLRFETESAYALGSCRTPVAAGAGSGGFDFDIEPGLPARSIMVFRMSSTSAKLKMPQIPTVTSDVRGVALISEWIASLTPEPCR